MEIRFAFVLLLAAAGAVLAGPRASSVAEVRVLLQRCQSATFELELPPLETLTVVEGTDAFTQMRMPGANVP